MNMSNELTNQVVLVTGATGGIGSAIAKRIVAAGAKVAVSGRDADKLQSLQKELGGEVQTVVADVADEQAVADAADAVRKHFGRIDTLINVPGLSVPAQLAQMKVEDFDRIFNVNVRGMFLWAKHFLKDLDATRGGLILNISSVAGKNANPNAPAYCAAKAAANMLASGLALQCKQSNVRVSTISPGAVSTPGFWGSRPVPHEKFLKPDDVARIVEFVVALPPHIVLHDVVFEPMDMFKGK
jgi:NADP-dependent 3-hydroxy acid dehydrogenase YdfG